MTLADGWTLTLINGPAPEWGGTAFVPAAVPGTVHTDLLEAHLIPDPYLDSNEASLAWIGLCDWRYETTFVWDDELDAAELVFEGIDTVATVRLNGVVIAETRNMHRSYRIAVRDLLVVGSNALQVDFSSPIKAANRASTELGYRTHVNHHPYNAIRKMACSFGWDWGIDTATSGLWRPVHVDTWSVARLQQVRPVPTVDGEDGLLQVNVDIARTTNCDVRVVVEVDGQSTSMVLTNGEVSATLGLRIAGVRKWWPVGYGDPVLYDLRVRLELASDHSLDGVTIDDQHSRIGFRTVSVDTTPDEFGSPFSLFVNDQPIFVKGANWIPDDAFPHRVDRGRYSRRLDQAQFAHVNLLRVWGGGIYESADFFELCDERGILTWQDFLLACAAYAEEEPLRSEIEAEAREAVARLARHPSLVVFNGNNENLWGHDEWNWSHRLDGATWGEWYYYELFPEIVAELAPHVLYTPGSPFTPNHDGTFDPDAHPNDPANGSTHLWDIWNRMDFAHFRDYAPRFVAEFGWQAPPSWSTLVNSISDDPLTPESPGMLVHQKAVEGNFKLTDGLIPHLRLPSTMADWHWAMQLNQANAVKTAIEWFRSLAPRCSGAIVWQLNDSWPATSWSAVDAGERAKPLLFALRAAFAPRRVLIQPTHPATSEQGLTVVVSNDQSEPWHGNLRVERLRFDGTELHSKSIPLSAGPYSQTTYQLDNEFTRAENPASELIRAMFESTRDLWFFAEYRDSDLPSDRFVATLTRSTDDTLLLELKARALLRDVTVMIDKLDPAATVNQALVTLLPGETTTFRINTRLKLPIESLTHPLVLRTANQLVTGYPESEALEFPISSAASQRISSTSS